MKKSVLLLLPIYLLSFVSCKGSFKTNYKIVLKVNEDQNGLVWDAVSGATKYLIVENEGVPYYVEQPGYLFNTNEVETLVTVSAVIDDGYDETYIGTGTYKYIGYESVNMELNYRDEGGSKTITASDFNGPDLLYKINDGEYSSIYPATSVNLNEYGFYTFKAPKGVKESSGEEPNIFYKKDKTISYYIPTDQDLPERKVVEDGSETAEELISKYTVKEQTPWGVWTDAENATLSLNDSGREGKCIELKFKDDGKKYRIETSFSPEYAFKKFCFSVNGSDAANKSVCFKHSKEEEIDGVLIPEFSLTNNLDFSYSNWFEYSNSFESFSRFTVDGLEISNLLETLREKGLIFHEYNYYIGNVLPFCDTFAFEVSGTHGTGGEISLLLDDFYFAPN